MGIRDLVKVANRLDNLGLNSEADALDRIIRKIAEEPQATAAPVGGSEDWKKGMPWPNTYDPNASSGPQGMAAEKAYPSKPAPAYGTYQDPEFSFARWVGSQDTVSNQTDRAAFEREFNRLWRMNKNSKGADPNDKYTSEQWIALGLRFSPMIWEGMQDRSVSAPKPKAPISGWDSYASKVPNGSAVKAMWVNNSGKILAGDNSFESFRRWLKDFMTKSQVKSIGAIDLVVNLQRMTDTKRAKNSDMRFKRNYNAPNSTEAAMEKAHNTGDKAEIKRLRDRLDIEEKTSYT